MDTTPKLENDSDVEVIEPEVLQDHFRTQQLRLITALSRCQCQIPKKWTEFENLVKNVLKFQLNSKLIRSVWSGLFTAENLLQKPDNLDLNDENFTKQISSGSSKVLQDVITQDPSLHKPEKFKKKIWIKEEFSCNPGHIDSKDENTTNNPVEGSYLQNPVEPVIEDIKKEVLQEISSHNSMLLNPKKIEKKPSPKAKNKLLKNPDHNNSNDNMITNRPDRCSYLLNLVEPVVEDNKKEILNEILSLDSTLHDSKKLNVKGELLKNQNHIDSKNRNITQHHSPWIPNKKLIKEEKKIREAKLNKKRMRKKKKREKLKETLKTMTKEQKKLRKIDFKIRNVRKKLKSCPKPFELSTEDEKKIRKTERELIKLVANQKSLRKMAAKKDCGIKFLPW